MPGVAQARPERTRSSRREHHSHRTTYTKEITMRNIVAGLFMSLDGVVEAPDQWHFPYMNDEMGAVIGAQMANSDTLLLGRVTYQEFAGYWADQPSDVPFADYIYNVPKLVASDTLDTAEWG